MHETTQGIYDALLRGRFAFDFVHEDRLEPERLSKYRALLLPNIAMLSDRQCQQIRDYVQSGGSIMASFETGLYDENLNQRSDFGFADMLGINIETVRKHCHNIYEKLQVRTRTEAVAKFLRR